MWFRHICLMSVPMKASDCQDELEKETIRNGYGYKVITFRYECSNKQQLMKEVRRSLFIPKMPLHLLLYLAKKYGQQMVAVKGDEGMDFITVEDEQLALSLNIADLSQAWCSFLFSPGESGSQ